MYHPVDTNGANLLSTPVRKIDAAILSVGHSFIVQNYFSGAALSTASDDTTKLRVRGSILQKFRGPVGVPGSNGYLKNYVFDTRLLSAPPPYFLRPLTSPWKVAKGDRVTGALVLGLRRARPARRLLPQRRRVARAARRVGRAPAVGLPGLRLAGPPARQRAGPELAAPARALPRLRRPDQRPLPAGRAADGRVFAVLAAAIGLDPGLPAFLYLGAVGVALALIDLDHKRLPDALTLPSYPVVVVLLGAGAALGRDEGSWCARCGRCRHVRRLLRAVLRLPGRDGLRRREAGRRARAGPRLGGLGRLDGRAVPGLPAGGVFGVGLLALRRGGRKTAVPFGPFMLAGALLGVLVGPELAGPTCASGPEPAPLPPSRD